MDVTVPPVPASYAPYRAALQTFIAERCPRLGWKQRTGLRVPESEEDVEALRSWVASLHDAGYQLARFSLEDTDPVEQRILEEELAATSLPYVLGNPLVSGALRTYGTPEQQDRYLGAMSRGEHIWTQLFSEPDAGSDLTSLKTRARLDGDEYVIDGQKVWSTWAQWSDFGYLLARTGGEGSSGITAFILDMKSAGIEIRPLREMTGTTDFSEVFFSEVRVPVGNRIGAEGEGWKVASASLAAERGGVGAGGSSDLVAGLLAVARQHRRSGRPALEDSSVRQDIGAFAARSRIQQYLAYATTTRGLHGEPVAWDAPLTKIWFSELNLEASEYALALQGPRSLLAEGDPDVYDDGSWQDRFLYARAWTIAGGSNEIMRNLIAERGLGLPREPRG